MRFDIAQALGVLGADLGGGLLGEVCHGYVQFLGHHNKTENQWDQLEQALLPDLFNTPITPNTPGAPPASPNAEPATLQTWQTSPAPPTPQAPGLERLLLPGAPLPIQTEATAQRDLASAAQASAAEHARRVALFTCNHY